MNENEFWVNVWKLVAGSVVGIFIIVACCDAYSTYTMLKMVEKGADPIKARCSVYGSGERNAAICALITQVK